MPTFAGMEQRDKFKGVESIKFYSRFTDDASCLEYLSSIKRADGFKCKKCGHTNYCNDRYPYSRRCTRCKYDESVTSGSMFDKIKFPLVYAFHIAFKISTKKKGMSSLELAESLEQLRWLENGYTIKVGISEVETIGIDTPEDLARAEAFLKTGK